MQISSPAVQSDREVGFWDNTLAAFSRAKAIHGCHAYNFRVAGYVIHLEVIGEKLKSFLVPAFLHCQLAGDVSALAPDLAIYAFDTASTGVPMPVPAWDENAYNIKESLAGFGTEYIRAAYNLGSGVFNIQNSETGTGVYWIHDANEHPQFEQSSPLRVQLVWWLRIWDRYFIHGGAIARENSGIILVGRGGSGKSTCCLSCLSRGWQYIGDDYILFGLEPEPTAFNLYQSAKLNVAHLRNHFPQLADTIYDYTTPDQQDKAILMLNDHFPGQIAGECRVKAIVLPKVTAGQSTRLLEIDPQTTIAGLIPSTLHQLPPLPPHDVRKMMQLVNSVPNYRLEICGGPYEIPDVLANLVA